MTHQVDEQSIRERIIELLKKGYTRSQLINDFGFAERTVDAAIKEYKKRYGDIPTEAKQANNSEITGLALPAKLDVKQVIAPEFLINHLSFVNGDQRQTFIDALLVYESARRSVMEDVMILQALTTAQAQTTETQLKILREAKSDSKEVAQAAAEGAAAIVGQQVQELLRQAASAGSPNPMAAMFTQAIQPYFTQAFARLFSMFGGFGQPPGMPNPPNQPPQPSTPRGQPPTFTPGSEQMGDEEVKEVFGND